MANIVATSASRDAVNTAIGQATDGDSVLIPNSNGAVAWSSGISTTKQIIIKAQNYTPTPGGNTTRNVILTNNCSGPLFTFTTGNSYHCGVAGMRFNNGTTDVNHIRFQGSGSKVFLLADCYMECDERYGTASDVAILCIHSLGGVIWNCRFVGTNSPGGSSILIQSPRSWNTASTMGTLDIGGFVNVYCEDSSFYNLGQCPDVDSAARWVSRYNDLDGTWGTSHGFTGPRGRAVEYYNNTFRVTDANRNMAQRYYWIRGGTGVFTDNVVNNASNPQQWGNVDLLDTGEAQITPTQYPMAQAPGMGHNGSLNVSDPMFIWNQTGARAYTWRIQSGWASHIVNNQDIFVNATAIYPPVGAKPNYNKYTYPHPARAYLEGGIEPLPSGNTGIAAAYPNDTGIASAPGVLRADGFDSYTSLSQMTSSGNWSNYYQSSNMLLDTSAGNFYGGTKALRIRMPQSGGEVSNALIRSISPTQDTLHVRVYSKYMSGYSGVNSAHNGIRITANYPGPGTKPNGSNFFYVGVEASRYQNETQPGYTNAYVYFPEQNDNYGEHWYPSGLTSNGDGPDGGFGPYFISRPNAAPTTGVWSCWEVMVKANTPGVRDGRIGVWLDGVIIADWQNIRFRDVTTVKINEIQLENGGQGSTQINDKWYDNVVIATSYIGPISAAQAPPTGTIALIVR